MTFRTSAIALLISAIAASASAAGTTTVVNVDSVAHGAWGFSHVPSSQAPSNLGPLDTGIAVNIGDTVTISTEAADKWGINGFYINAHGTASVFGTWNTTDLGFAGQSTPLQYGSLAYSIDGQTWGETYTDINNLNDTSITFVAAQSGTVRLAMWDSIVSDNGLGGNVLDTQLAATITVVPGVSAVPEPSAIALFGIGALVCVGLNRRKRAS
jgi:hypothetical protein